MFKQRDTTTNSAWHSPGKGSLGSRGQTIFIWPPGDFCCTLMTSENIIHLYSPDFLTIQESKVRPITGYRHAVALHVLFLPLQTITCSLGHRPPRNLPCIKGRTREKAVALRHDPGDGTEHEVHQWSLFSADSQESAWSMASQTTTVSSTIIWGWWMQNTTEGFYTKPSLCLSSPESWGIILKNWIGFQQVV